MIQSSPPVRNLPRLVYDNEYKREFDMPNRRQCPMSPSKMLMKMVNGEDCGGDAVRQYECVRWLNDLCS